MRGTGVFVALLCVLGPAPTMAVAQDQLTFDIPLRISAEEGVVVPPLWLGEGRFKAVARVGSPETWSKWAK